MQFRKLKGHWYQRFGAGPAEMWNRVRSEERIKELEKMASLEVKPSRLGMWDQLLRKEK